MGQVFNVGSDEEVSINELAGRVIRLSGSSSKIEHISYEKAYGQSFDDMVRRVPKLDKVRSVISFQPKLNLDQIIRSVIDDKKPEIESKQ
jgi:UDP-glucose 4-epimerase